MGQMLMENNGFRILGGSGDVRVRWKGCSDAGLAYSRPYRVGTMPSRLEEPYGMCDVGASPRLSRFLDAFGPLSYVTVGADEG